MLEVSEALGDLLAEVLLLNIAWHYLGENKLEKLNIYYIADGVYLNYV